MIRIYFSIGALLLSLSVLAQENTLINVDYVKEQLEGMSYTEQIETLIQEFKEHLQTNPELSEEIIKFALQLTTDKKDSLGIAQTSHYLAQAYVAHGKSTAAIDLLMANMALCKKLGDSEKSIDCLTELGTAHKNVGDYQKALKYDIEALKAAENLAYKQGIINANLNISIIFLIQKNYTKSIEYLNKCLVLQEDDDLGKMTTYNNLGTSYKGLKNYEKALNYYQKSLVLAKENNNIKAQSKPLNNIGVLYLERKEFDKALEYLLQVEAIEKKTGNKQGLIGTYINIGLVQRYSLAYEAAIKSFLKADSLATITNSLYEQSVVYLNLSLVYEEYEKYIKSIDYLYNYISLTDSLFNERKTEQLTELSLKYETDKKQQEIELLRQEKKLKALDMQKQQAYFSLEQLKDEAEHEKEQNKLALLKQQNEIQELVLEKKISEIERLNTNASLSETRLAAEKAKADKETTIRNVTILISLLIVIPILVLLIFYQQKIKAQSIVSIRNEQLNQKRILELIKDYEIKTFKAQLEGQEIEKKRIASDLHDGIGGNLASIKLGLNKLDDNLGGIKGIKQIMSQVNATCEEIRTISHDLTPNKILNSAYVELIKEYVFSSLDATNIQANFQAYPETALNNIGNKIKIEIYRIIQELLSNTITHSQATAIDVSINLNEESLILMMEDTGVGFNPSKTAKGIGLLNIESRVASVNGKLNIDSIIGRGTIFTVEIPIEVETAA